MAHRFESTALGVAKFSRKRGASIAPPWALGVPFSFNDGKLVRTLLARPANFFRTNFSERHFGENY